MKTLTLGLVAAMMTVAQAQQPPIPVKVELVTRAVAKTPVLIAYDRGIYRKYGLDVTLWLPAGEFPGAIETPGRMDNPDFRRTLTSFREANGNG